MPLQKGKSKQAFEHNIKAEIAAGKPQDQALAIAYDIKKRSAKKMANGGEVKNIKNQKRPMPNQVFNDAKMAQENSNKKQLKEDQWTDSPTVKQAQKPSITKLSQPKFVESSVIRSKLRDQEDDMMDSMPPSSPKQQPSKVYDEMDAKKSGPKVPDMQKQHNNGKAAYAKGGSINGVVSFDDAEEDKEEHPAGLEMDNDQKRPPVDEYMADHFAEGGMAHEFDDQPMEEADEEHEDSLVAAIMAKRDRMKSGSGSMDMDEAENYYEGGQVKIKDKGQADVMLNGKEHPNYYYKRNDEILKENYMDDMKDVSQPMDSNEMGDDIESDVHDMVSKIRSKMMKQRQFKGE